MLNRYKTGWTEKGIFCKFMDQFLKHFYYLQNHDYWDHMDTNMEPQIWIKLVIIKPLEYSTDLIQYIMCSRITCTL